MLSSRSNAPTPDSREIRLPSGPSIKLVVQQFRPGKDRWLASLTLLVTFEAETDLHAEEMAFAALDPVLEAALRDVQAKQIRFTSRTVK
jgi:hypothetical protein